MSCIGRCVDAVESWFEEGGCLQPYVLFLHSIVRHLGKFLVLLVHCIALFISAIAYLVILPYEQLYQSKFLLTLHTLLGTYLLVNILYHYTKARLLAPIQQAGLETDRWCRHCGIYKSDRTHHCSVCRTCVLGMDHHCIWINQCVGTHNHRHFFQFILALTLVSVQVLVAGWHTFHDHLISFRPSEWSIEEDAFCQTRLDYAPAQEWLCRDRGVVRHAVLFAYALCAILAFLVGALTVSNIWFISKGITYIDYLKRGNRGPRDRSVRGNWIQFLGLRRNRTFCRYILLPSGHPATPEDTFTSSDKPNIV